ncbi:MAG TPA: PDZ domain-containing protein [Puia sp.]|nr:PDZ domain-containing protein [Puia sp.]
MKRHLLKIAGLAILAMLIQSSGFAQQDNLRDGDDDAPRRVDEIVIRHKGNKDAKLTIEIKDGDILVNGKPLDEFDDSSVTVSKRRIIRDRNRFSYNGSEFEAPDFPGTIRVWPGNGENRTWSYGNSDLLREDRAQLGVGMEKNGDDKGAKVIQITKGSAAEKTGLKVGDVITKVDGTEIEDPGSLSETIGHHKPGDKITVTVTRDGKEQKIPVILGKAKAFTVEPFNMYKFEMPDMKAPVPGNWPKEFLGTYGNSVKFGIRAQDDEDGKGAKILDVDDESAAAKAGLKEGDVITRFDGKEIKSVTDLTEAARAAREKTSVKVSILRDGKSQELDVKVPKRLRTADL